MSPPRLLRAFAALVLAGPLAAQRPDSAPAGRAALSVAADAVADLSPEGATLRDSSRFALRELELGARGVVAGVHATLLLRALDGGTPEVHQAFATADLPLGVAASAGRLPLPFGEMNEVHGHALPLAEPSLPHRRYLGEANVTALGLRVSRQIAPWLDLSAAMVDGLAGGDSGRTAIERPNRYLTGLGFVGRIGSGWRMSGVRGRVSLSGMSGRRLQPLSAAVRYQERRIDAVVARQSVVGAELVLGSAPAPDEDEARWTVAGQALWQLNEREEALRDRIPLDPLTGGPFYEGPTRDAAGGSVLARARVRGRLWLTGRFDRVEEPLADDGVASAGSLALEWRTLDGMRLSAEYERLARSGRAEVDRVLLRARFALGERAGRLF